MKDSFSLSLQLNVSRILIPDSIIQMQKAEHTNPLPVASRHRRMNRTLNLESQARSRQRVGVL